MSEDNDKNGIKLKCQRCENEWIYNGQNDWYATCPRCLIKVNVKKNKVE